MKKKLITMTMILSMACALAGCGSSASDDGLSAAAKVVTLGTYKGMELTLTPVTNESIDEYINSNLLSASTSYVQIKEGTVADGDLVNINYSGKKDGVAFEGGTDDSEAGHNLAIGSNSFIDGFEQGLIGVKVGDTVDLNLTFPENYTSTELAGQDVVFTVTVNYICGEKITPELTDEFVASNTSYKSVEEYKAFVNETLTKNNRSTAEETLWKQAVENAQISQYPQEDIDAALQTIRNYYEGMAQYYSTTFDALLQTLGSSEATFDNDMLETAQGIVANKLVALAIAQEEKLKISDELYDTKVKEYVITYGAESKEALEEQVSVKTLREQIYMDLAQEFILTNAIEK